MKFAVVAVLLAVALGSEASAVAWGPWGNVAYAPTWGSAGSWDGRSWNSEWNNGHDAWTVRSALNDGQWHEGAWGDRSGWAGHGAWVAPAAVAVAPAYAPASVAIQAAAVPVAHAAVVPAAHSGWAHEGSYVAKTRGAVHVSPLAGHAKSVASINLHPAPGTV